MKRDHQKLVILDQDDAVLQEAYERMNMAAHSWTKGTQNEVACIQELCQSGTVLDLGCGIGRHAIALADAGFHVTAVDRATTHIDYAREKAGDRENLRFVLDDVRYYHDNCLYDMVLCLYDVVGSYPDKNDNRSIIKTAYRQLKNKGIFCLSVMNMELTESLIPNTRKKRLNQHPEILEELPPSNTMQRTGAIFDPDYLALDTERNLVYRKEQFNYDTGLPAEYIIRDKRYRKYEIEELLKQEGFRILQIRYVQAGHFDVELDAFDPKAKEIYIVCEKNDSECSMP